MLFESPVRTVRVFGFVWVHNELLFAFVVVVVVFSWTAFCYVDFKG